MDIRQIESFVNVVRYKSFSRAADASFLTQSTISIHVSRLEKELGVILIDRKGKEALPTEYGKKLLNYAQNILNTRDQAINAIRSEIAEIEGVLEIQASSVPGQYILPSIMADFRKEYQKVKFYLEQSDSKIVEKNLILGNGEIGILGIKGNSNLIYQRLFSDSMVLITPKEKRFLELDGREIEFGQVEEEPIIWREEGSATRKEFERCLIGSGKDPKNIQIVAFSNNLEAVKRAVGSGLGISVVSELATEPEICDDGKDFLTFRFKDIHIKRDFFIAWKRNTALSPTALEFKRYVIKHFEGK